jgi:four helix bundle protein
MQLRRSAVNVASHIAEAHGRLNDAEMRKGLGSARAAPNALETQAELASGMGSFPSGAADVLFELSSEVGKLINGLIGVLGPTPR